MCLNYHLDKRLVVVFLLSISLCCLTACDKPIPTPRPTPVPPADLQDLPRTARVEPFSGVWELPGYPPIDPESDISPYMGKQLGVTTEGEVLVLDYAWSEAASVWFNGFFVRIRQGDLEGWVLIENIHFD